MIKYYDNYKEQTPDEAYDWLYKDEREDVRNFATSVTLPLEADEWAECTNAEKDEWEREHPQPEPEK